MPYTRTHASVGYHLEGHVGGRKQHPGCFCCTSCIEITDLRLPLCVKERRLRAKQTRSADDRTKGLTSRTQPESSRLGEARWRCDARDHLYGRGMLDSRASVSVSLRLFLMRRVVSCSTVSIVLLSFAGLAATRRREDEGGQIRVLVYREERGIFSLV